MYRSAAVISACACLSALGVLGGCSPSYYARTADRASYDIVDAKAPQVPGMLEGFRLAEKDETPPALPTGPLTLEQALAVATLNSRSYRAQQESLFLRALGLTGIRRDYVPNLFGVLTGDYDNIDTGDEEEISASSDFGFTWLLRTGATLAVGLTTSVSKLLTGDHAEAAGSVFAATLRQPLLRGFGYDTNEPLRQAERDMIYQMRSFVRYRRTFFVSIVSDYYRVLEQAQVLENERLNRDNLTTARKRAEMLLEAGRMPRFEVDQTRQDELNAENRLQNAEQNYRASLDSFKVTLGLTADTDLELDPTERDRLLAIMEQIATDLTPEAAAEIARANRLDLMTSWARVEDAERGVKLARLELRPSVDLVVGAAVATTDNQPADFDTDGTDFNAGLDVDLPLDKLDERNSYRRALIGLDQARRDYAEDRDRIVLDVRDALRQYRRSRRSYEILKESLRLAEERVESTSLLLETGRASTRDMLEARESLLSAQNSLVAALVDYKLAGLQLSRDMGILEVGQMGQLKENFDEYE